MTLTVNDYRIHVSSHCSLVKYVKYSVLTSIIKTRGFDSFLRPPHINITEVSDMLLNTYHNLFLALRLPVGLGYQKDNRRCQLCREHFGVVIDKQSAFHHTVDNFLIHLLNADKLVAGGNLGESVVAELFLNKEFAYFSNHRVVNGKRDSAHCHADEFFPAFGQFADMLLRAE